MIKSCKLSQENQSGLVLITTMIIISTLMIIGLALLSQTAGQYAFTGKDTYNDNAILAAESGVEQSLDQLNQNNSFTGYGTAQQLYNNTTQGCGKYTTTIATSPTNSAAKVITSTSTMYRYGCTRQVSSRIVQVTVVGTSSPGYSVESGPGGLILGGSAAITNSQVYVNGNITMAGAARIGTVSQPLNVNVANYACASGSNYPVLCSSAQPISLQQSTYVYGSVCATGQTSLGPGGNEIQAGTGGQGLETGCTAPTVSMPSYDRTGQIAAVTTTGSDTSGSAYDCSNWNASHGSDGFTVTWPANLELTGNVSLSSSCNLTITGNVYITGNLSIAGAAKVTVANSVGGTRPVILVDGTVTVGGSGQLIANSSGTGLEVISFCSLTAAKKATCTDPSSLTGTALQTSAGIATVTVGGAAAGPGMIFDAYWGEIVLTGSGNMGSAIGQTVNMSGAGTITFGTSLSSGTETWTVTSYQQKYPY